MDALTLDFLEVFVTPVETAEALSETKIVTRSYVWLARTSRKPSAKRPPELYKEPGDALEDCCDLRVASCTYCSSEGFSCDAGFFFGAAITNDENIQSVATGYIFMSSSGRRPHRDLSFRVDNGTKVLAGRRVVHQDALAFLPGRLGDGIQR